MWAAAAPSLSSLHPSSWAPAGLATLWGGSQQSGEEYLGLPLADTEMGPDRHVSFSPETPATLYEPPSQETTAPSHDQRSLPGGS